MSRRERLHCERGNHPWERASARGRKPRNCHNEQCATPHPDLIAPVTERDEITESDDHAATVSAAALRIDNLTANMAVLIRRDAERLRLHRTGNAY